MSIDKDIKVGISSCLLGENVRFNGGHKKNSYVCGILNQYFNFIPFCPEVKIGLGIPRESVRLVKLAEEVRCVGTKTTENDVTEQLTQTAEERSAIHEGLSGYILKKDSPSCGMERVKIYNGDVPKREGVGIFSKKLMQMFPNLPVEEEGRLEDVHLRENFIQRIYIYSRWRDMLSDTLTLAGLQVFHAQHKYIFMSHNQDKARMLGEILADAKKSTVGNVSKVYLSKMMELLKIIATRKNHVNTLQHIQGYLKNYLDSGDKQELQDSIEEYRKGLLPLIVPITLLRHHFRRNPDVYIDQSYYMKPHPGELMLLNHI